MILTKSDIFNRVGAIAGGLSMLRIPADKPDLHKSINKLIDDLQELQHDIERDIYGPARVTNPIPGISGTEESSRVVPET